MWIYIKKKNLKCTQMGIISWFLFYYFIRTSIVCFYGKKLWIISCVIIVTTSTTTTTADTLHLLINTLWLVFGLVLFDYGFADCEMCMRLITKCHEMKAFTWIFSHFLKKKMCDCRQIWVNLWKIWKKHIKILCYVTFTY